MSAEKVKRAIEKAVPGLIPEVSIDERGIVTIKGNCSDWNQVVDAGHTAAQQKGVKNVVNKLLVNGKAAPQKDYSHYREMGKKAGVIAETDVLIIGSGISGCGIARELSKYKLDIIVAEMCDDVATGATKANNGNIHPGYAEKPGTLKVKLNVEGNRMYTRWSQELGFELQRSGAMAFVTNPLLKPVLRLIYKRALKNCVDGAELVNCRRACELEPGLVKNGYGDKVKMALWLPTMGLVEPYKVTVALAENASDNGVRFLFNCTVANILHENGRVLGAVTNRGIIKAKYVINCAGVYADDISAMAGDECFTIHPRKGIIAILDKAKRPRYESLCEYVNFDFIKHYMKKANTKGGGLCRTPEYNTLLGPSATEISDKEDLGTTPEDLANAMEHRNTAMGYDDIIRFFAGNRPADYKEDFVIEMSPLTNGFINVAAIQSPGLASAPAIAKMVEGILSAAAEKNGSALVRKSKWNPNREAKPEFRRLDRKEQDELIKNNPAYGRIICRCESISEGEILDAIHSSVVPTSVDAIKRRTRAGMGRCQGGFCQPRVLEILARELGKSKVDVTLKGEGSSILLKNTRNPGEEENA